MSTSVTSSPDVPPLESVLLLGASRRAAAFSEEARARMKPYAVAAQARYRAALELRDLESQAAAFGLLREAALLALYALSAANSGAVPEARSHRAMWDGFLVQERPGAPGALAEASIVLGSDDVLAADSVAPSDAPVLRSKAEETVAWLLSLAEIRSPRALKRARIVRSSLLLLALIASVCALGRYWAFLVTLH